MSMNDQDPREDLLVLDRVAQHMIRNHLSIIQGFCDVIQHDVGPSNPLFEDLLQIKQAAEAALAILNGAQQR
jgi:hypothetical protein